MPVTTVQKIITVMIIVIRRMKASPKGFMATACVGLTAPKLIAATMPKLTWTQRDEYQRRVRGADDSDGNVGTGVVIFRSCSLARCLSLRAPAAGICYFAGASSVFTSQGMMTSLKIFGSGQTPTWRIGRA